MHHESTPGITQELGDDARQLKKKKEEKKKYKLQRLGG